MKQREIVRTVNKAGVRIWLGSLPALFSFEASEWVIHSVGMKSTGNLENTWYAGLRLSVHDFSGQLGVIFLPQKSETLTIKVGVADLEIPGLLIRKGIPGDYAQVIVTTLPAKAGSFSGYARRNRPR